MQKRKGAESVLPTAPAQVEQVMHFKMGRRREDFTRLFDSSSYGFSLFPFEQSDLSFVPFDMRRYILYYRIRRKIFLVVCRHQRVNSCARSGKFFLHLCFECNQPVLPFPFFVQNSSLTPRNYGSPSDCDLAASQPFCHFRYQCLRCYRPRGFHYERFTSSGIIDRKKLSADGNIIT